MQVLLYIGPRELRARLVGATGGAALSSRHVFMDWLSSSAAERESEAGWTTYVVALDGVLRVAPRRTEHVACAGGAPVLAAGEMRFGADGQVLEVNNVSTGYCPPADCWAAVAGALQRAEVLHPPGFTFFAQFRRCLHCRQTNLVKDDWLWCSACNAELPAEWNFGAPVTLASSGTTVLLECIEEEAGFSLIIAEVPLALGEELARQQITIGSTSFEVVYVAPETMAELEKTRWLVQVVREVPRGASSEA